MRKKTTPEIENNLTALREKRGLPAAQLARLVNVTRQTIYAMEANDYVPNTALALKLARVLDVRVEDLFILPGETQPPELRTAHAIPLAGTPDPYPGQSVQLCQVDKRLLASTPSPVPWYFPLGDAVVSEEPAKEGRLNVKILQAGKEFTNRILIAGCDPGISILARHVQAAGVELVLAHRNSSQSLELLKQGSIHIAGTHLRDDASGESNIPEIGRKFTRRSVAVISFAVWEEGIVTARGNPKHLKSIEDFARPDVSIVNRETGAGTRKVLDAHLKRLGLPGSRVRGYDRTAEGHLAGAWQVMSGQVDACIATHAAARMLGLGFVPLVSERYDLAIHRHHLDLPAIQTLLETLSRSSFRRELESLGGYDTTAAGQRLL